MNLHLSVSEYPLTSKGIAAAVVAALLTAAATDAPLAGYAIFVLLAGASLTWRRERAPIFPFIIALQWLEVTAGYFFSLIVGVFPSEFPPGDVNYAVGLALTGLLVLALGIRLAGALLPRATTSEPEEGIRNLKGLFWAVMIVYAVNYVYVLNPKAYAGFDAILERLLGMRQIPLMLLWFEVVRRRTNWSYLWLSLAWVFVPQLGSYFSEFKAPLILVLIVFASNWKPWESSAWRFSAASVARTLLVASACLFLVLTWQAGVKKETRRAYDAQEVGGNPAERIALFVSHAADAIPIVFNETEAVVESLIARISYVTFFSRTLEYVPLRQPHTDGELLQMALTNAFMPRFLFPDKPILPSDSYYTRRFTGILVPDENTSISIGYMAEFYADWGLEGMFISILLYGSLMGLGAWMIERAVAPRILIDATTICALMVVSLFEHQFVKTFAAMNIGIALVLITIAIARPSLTRFLDVGPLDSPNDDVDDVEPVVEPAEPLDVLPVVADGSPIRGRVLPMRRPS